MTFAILIVTVALIGWLLIYMFSQKPATSAQQLIQTVRAASATVARGR